MQVTQVDIAIIGGGMVGASLAVALAGSGLTTMLVESTAPGSGSQPSFDDRTTALGNASRRIFQSLGVWERIAPAAAAIRTIHICDAGRFGFARLKAEEQDIEAFGYVVSNRIIGAALWEKLQNAKDVLLRVPCRPADVEISDDRVTFTLTEQSSSASTSGTREQVSARLVVAADGANSIVRAAAGIEADIEDYDQIAIVANVAADHPNDGTAYERFTQSGPLAVLPLQDGSYGVIWTCTPARAAEVLSFDDQTYLQELQARFGWRAGRFVRAGVRVSYPLKLTRATTPVAKRTVLIGNAAQALHPVAGQGFNLGLRDAAMLAEVVVNAMAGTPIDVTRGAGATNGGAMAKALAAGAATNAGAMADALAAGAATNAGATATARASRGDSGGTAGAIAMHDATPADATRDIGSPELLRQFARWRAGDRVGVTRFTDGLVKLFGDTRPGVGLMRDLGLLLFDLSPPAKSALARVSAGFAGPTPRLARGLRLRP